MLKKLSLQHITNFEQAELNFVPGINIIIGENSTGKSHLLKMAYSIAVSWNQFGQTGWRPELIQKLHGVFGIEQLIQLRRQETVMNAEQQSVLLEVFVNHKKQETQTIQFHLDKRDKIQIAGEVPHAAILNKPLFFPAKEVLSIYPNFTALYEKYEMSFDETYYDLCKAIANPLLKQPNYQLIETIETIIGGKIILRGSHFYLQTEANEINIFMVSEGWRKLGMLAYLIANDSLKEGTTLFWDEPETNLNPRLMKQLAQVLIELTQHGIQIIIATHHLFLMKYFDFLLADTELPATFFSLKKTQNGTEIEQGKNLSDLNTITSLEEELALYDKEQQALYANL